jgi:hypothetical protein
MDDEVEQGLGRADHWNFEGAHVGYSAAGAMPQVRHQRGVLLQMAFAIWWDGSFLPLNNANVEFIPP